MAIGSGIADIYQKMAPKQSALYQLVNMKKAFEDAKRQNQIDALRDQRKQYGNERTAMIGQGYIPNDIMGKQTQPQSSPDQSASLMASGGATTTPTQQDSSNTTNIPGYTYNQNNSKTLALQEKQDQFDQRQWTMFVNKNNPTIASSRSTLGMAANGNLRADRALATVQNNPTMTYQDLGNVVGDLAGIYQGGAPTDRSMKHQQYESLQMNISKLKQFALGNPTATVPDSIKQKLVDTITKLKSINNEAISQHFSVQEKAQRKLIDKFPQEWADFKQQISENYGGQAQQSQPTGQGKTKSGNTFQRID